MISSNAEVDDYLAALPDEQRPFVTRLRQVIVENLPRGFEEVMAGCPSYVVPLSKFPEGYHCRPGTPLPFLSFALQKNFLAIYHFGMYADKKLLDWFVTQYPKHVNTKLDMGKSCIRFRKPGQIPFILIGDLAAQRTVDQWLKTYQRQVAHRA